MKNLLRRRLKRGFIFDLTRKNVCVMTFWALLLFVFYCLYMRGLTPTAARGDMLTVIIFSAVFPLFLVYSIACFVKPQLHPNYLRINKLGDIDGICAAIDEEIRDESVYKDKKTIYTKRYTIYHSLYSTRVSERRRDLPQETKPGN